MEQTTEQPQPPQNLPLSALTCLNGLKHGGTSMTLFIPGEQPQDFYNLLAESFETHQPSTGEDSNIVMDAVVSRWFLWRRQRVHSKREFNIYSETSEIDDPGLSGLKDLALYDRYRIQAERTHARALANLRNLKKNAGAGDKWRALLELQKSRLELQRQRFELRQAQDARVAGKIAAEAARDAHLADGLHELMKQSQAAAPQPPKTATPTAEAPKDPLVMENRESFLKQTVFVNELSGGVRVVPQPENSEIQAIIDTADRCVVPPQKVVRDFYFIKGVIPKSYEWVLEGIDRAAAVAVGDYPPKTCLRIPLTFEKWQKLAAQEALLIEAQAKVPLRRM